MCDCSGLSRLVLQERGAERPGQARRRQQQALQSVFKFKSGAAAAVVRTHVFLLLLLARWRSAWQHQ